jgi:hypothetical protein
MTRTRTVAGGVMFAIVLVAEFAVFEAALRLRGGSEASPQFQGLFTPDDRVGYRLKPGARARFTTVEFDTNIAINQQGVRDEEIGPKAAGERRIVVLGDSLVLAVQVDAAQTFCRGLERRLNATAPPGIQYRVINAGVQGYGPVEDVLFYEEMGSRFQADLVMLALFVGNDAVEASDSAWKLEPGRASVAAVREDTVNTLRRLARRSMVLQIARMRVLAATARLEPTPLPERPLGAYLPDPPPDVVRGLTITRTMVDRFVARAEHDGARPAIVLLPARFQLEDGDYSRLAEIVRNAGSTLIRDAATDRFRRALDGVAAPVFDALPALRRDPDRATLFFERTVHFTPRGHEVMAAALADFVRERHLLEAVASAPESGSRVP